MNDERAPNAETQSLANVIRTVMLCDPSADAVEYAGRWIQWRQLHEAVGDLRERLDEAGVPLGARVGVLLRNRPAQLAAALAILIEEYCLVTLNPLYPDAVLAHDIATLALPIVVGEAADLERTGVAEAARTADTGVIALGSMPGEPSRLLRRGAPRPAGGDDAIEMLTSGTTGRPKRIPLQRNRFQRALRPALEQEAGEGGRIVAKLRPGCRILTAPLTHIGGIWGALRAMIAGRKLVLLEKFSLPEWRDAVRRHRPLSVGVSPAGLKMILDANVPADDLSSLKAIAAGTAPTRPEIIDEFWDRYRLPILVNYGATEFGGPVANWSLDDFHNNREAKRGSVGRLYADVEARTTDPETGEVQALGAVGVLELKGKQFPDPNTWLRTTDLARVDEDRFLWIAGRSDGTINRGGFKVQPDDVVKALESHADVREAVVTGIADERLGQVPAAAVILKEGASFDLDALNLHLRARLLPYQVPVLIEPMEDFPRIGSMKPMVRDIGEILSKQWRERS